MLYDLRAKLSEVSSAAKKRQADAAAREASLEESLQLAQQRLAVTSVAKWETMDKP